MLQALYQKLTQLSAVKEWLPYGTELDGRSPPFGVYELGSHLPAVDNAAGSFISVRLWVYWPRGSWAALEQACESIRRELDGAVLVSPSGERHRLEWVQTTAGFIDPDLDAFARRLEFRLPWRR